MGWSIGAAPMPPLISSASTSTSPTAARPASPISCWGCRAASREPPTSPSSTCSARLGPAVRTAERGLSFSSRVPLADVGSSEERAGYGYVQFVAHAPSWEGGVAVPLPGVFNVTPALAAITVLELLGVRGREVQEGLCMAATQGHGELLFPPEQHVCAVVEQSRDPRDRRQIVEAARQEFEGFSTEVVTELAGIEPAVARGYARARSTLLVLLGRPGEAYADAFQAAVRRHFAWSTPPRG